MSTREQDKAAGERFAADTADHEMTVLLDDGLYRHLSFKKPGTSSYWFDVITWPGRLTLDGDMGTWTFARIPDMFEFFRSSNGLTRINPGYWSEKLQAGASGGGRMAEEYDPDLFKQMVNEHVADLLQYDDWPEPAAAALRAAVDEDIFGDETDWEEPARRALDAFDFEYDHEGTTYKHRFRDTWEWNLHSETIHFLWSCWAIAHAVAEYDRAKAVAA